MSSITLDSIWSFFKEYTLNKLTIAAFASGFGVIFFTNERWIEISKVTFCTFVSAIILMLLTRLVAKVYRFLFEKHLIQRNLKEITEQDRKLISRIKNQQTRIFTLNTERYDLIAIAERLVDFGIAKKRLGTNKEVSYEIHKEYFYHKDFK